MAHLNTCKVVLTINSAEYVVQFSAKSSESVVSLDAAHITEKARRFNDLVEMSFHLSAPHPEEAPRRSYVVAVFPRGTRHYLGPVNAGAEVPSARLVRRVPAFLSLEFHRDALLSPRIETPWPSEMLLKEHVKAILDTDAYCGSIACSHVQNMVKDLPFYTAGMHRFSNWSDFVRHFHKTYGSWLLVIYRRRQHELLELSDLVVPDELRMVLNKYRHGFVRGDVLRDRVKWRALLRFRDEAALLQCGASSDDQMIKVTVSQLAQLGLSASFRELNRVNITHYLNGLPHRERLVMSPFHPIQIPQSPKDLPSRGGGASPIPA